MVDPDPFDPMNQEPIDLESVFLTLWAVFAPALVLLVLCLER